MAVLGPTASGKSEVAQRLAEELDGEILSVDSMQVYRGMDIGTAKPGTEERRRVRHHMIDVAEPEESYSAARFQAEARAALGEAGERLVVIVGGSGLHFRAVVDPMSFPPNLPGLRRRLESLETGQARARLLDRDPEAGRHVDLDNPRRVVRALEVAELTGLTPSRRARSSQYRDLRSYRPLLEFTAVGIDPGDALAARVEGRLDGMLAAGLLDEVEHLSGRMGPTAAQAVGYRQLLPVVRGERSVEEGRAAALRATRALAKRQRTFFRRDPRIGWVDWSADPEARYRQVRAAVEEALCAS